MDEFYLFIIIHVDVKKVLSIYSRFLYSKDVVNKHDVGASNAGLAM